MSNNQQGQGQIAVRQGPQQSQALAMPNGDVKLMKQWVSSARAAFAAVLPKAMQPERFVRVAHVAIDKEPKLARCQPRSLIMALLHAAELGLEPNTPLQHAFIIPYGDEAQFQMGYRGVLDLIERSEMLADLVVELVYEDDDFAIELGDEPKIRHVINPKSDRDPAKVIGAYMSAKLTNGGRRREWMSRAQIDAIRRNFAAGGSKAWNQPETWGEMARKTVFKRGAKRLPKANAYLQRAIEVDDLYERRAGGERGLKASFSAEALAALPPEVLGESATDRAKAAAGVGVDPDGRREVELTDGGGEVVVESGAEPAKQEPAKELPQARTVQQGNVVGGHQAGGDLTVQEPKADPKAPRGRGRPVTEGAPAPDPAKQEPPTADGDPRND